MKKHIYAAHSEIDEFDIEIFEDDIDVTAELGEYHDAATRAESHALFD